MLGGGAVGVIALVDPVRGALGSGINVGNQIADITEKMDKLEHGMAQANAARPDKSGLDGKLGAVTGQVQSALQGVQQMMDSAGSSSTQASSEVKALTTQMANLTSFKLK